MPRTGPQRTQTAVRIITTDKEEIDALAQAAGVHAGDVIRAGVEIILRGLDRQAVTSWLAERGREASQPLTPERWDFLHSGDGDTQAA